MGFRAPDTQPAVPNPSQLGEKRPTTDSDDITPTQKRTRKTQPAKPTSQGLAGRVPGKANYTPEESAMLLKILKKNLPIGPAMFLESVQEYNKWAKDAGYPVRTEIGLKTRFERVSTRFIIQLLVLTFL